MCTDCIVEKFGQQAYTEHGTQIKDKSNQKCRDKAKKLQTTVKPESEVAHSWTTYNVRSLHDHYTFMYSFDIMINVYNYPCFEYKLIMWIEGVRILPRKAGILTRKAGILPRKAGILTRKAGILPRKVGILTRKAEILPTKVGILTRKAGILGKRQEFGDHNLGQDTQESWARSLARWNSRSCFATRSYPRSYQDLSQERLLGILFTA